MIGQISLDLFWRKMVKSVYLLLTTIYDDLIFLFLFSVCFFCVRHAIFYFLFWFSWPLLLDTGWRRRFAVLLFFPNNEWQFFLQRSICSMFWSLLEWIYHCQCAHIALRFEPLFCLLMIGNHAYECWKMILKQETRLPAKRSFSTRLNTSTSRMGPQRDFHSSVHLW